MNISEIYKKYSVPPNLAEHMLTVTKVIKILQKHWRGEKIDWNEMELIGLLHDIGNIVKFDFDKYPELLGEEERNIVLWKNAQSKIIKRYGNDDHEVTRKIIKEIGLSPHISEIILNKSFGNSTSISKSKNWYIKILAYADLRVLPNGIGSLVERIEDIKKRMPKYADRKDFPELVKAAYEIEVQIQGMVDLSLDNIVDSLTLKIS